MTTEKKGKLFVKDSSGSIVQVIPEAIAVIPDYQGSTASSAGISGLVPAALSNQREKYLRGDGIWADAGVPNGTCDCTYANVRKTFNAGVSICDGDGSWLSTAVILNASVFPTESRQYQVHFRFGADGPGGCAYWLPYNSTPPQSMEERTYEFYRDTTLFYRNNSNHFIQTFSNGFSMDSWIVADTESAGYHYLYIMVYGPQAPDIPRSVPLNVDGTNIFLTQNLAAGESAEIPVSGTTIKLFPRPTFRTALYRNEFYEYDYSSANAFAPVELTSTPYQSPYLSYSAVRTENGIRITANNVNINDWPSELSSVSLSLTSGTTTNVIDMNCLPSWMSLQLTKVDERIAALNSRIDGVGIYQGATTNESGFAGLVPPAIALDKDKFLKGDGTWQEVSTAKEVGYVSIEPTVQGVQSLDNESIVFYELQSMGAPGTSEVANISISGNAGTATLVNHSMSISVDGGSSEGSSLYTFNGSAEKTLNIAGGSGISLSATTGTVTVSANSLRGATASFDGIAGIVPAPLVADKEKYLKGDGTWAEVPHPQIVTSAELSTGTDTSIRTVSPKVIHDYVSDKIAGLVNSAPTTLDTLNELASALGNDPNFATTVATSLGTCLSNIEKTTRVASEQQTIVTDILLVSCTNEVLQQLSTYYSSNSTEKWVYDGNYFSENGSRPSSYDASVNIKIQKFQDKWTLETEPALASLNNGARSFTEPHDMPFGTHVIDIWENNNPLFVRVEYILTNSGEVTFTRYDIYSKNTSSNTVSRSYSDLLISKKNNSTIQLDLTYTGATSSASGISGFVPSALPSERDFYLKGDGTWNEIETITNSQIDDLFV